MQKFLSGGVGSRNIKGSRNNRLFLGQLTALIYETVWKAELEVQEGSGKVCGCIKGFWLSFPGSPGSTPEPSWMWRQESGN